MHQLVKKLYISIFSLVILSLVSLSAAAVVVNYSPGTSFKVIQDEIVFDKNTVKSATVLPPRSVVDHFYRVLIVLNTDATAKMDHLANDNIGKQAMIIVNNQVVSRVKIMSSLGNKFQISGLTKTQATQLVNSIS